ncbi:nitrate reductase [Kistimonas asteriae]|uniref:nitrate reductase n=1 Tax=Kistimonas asteriae TaxID=517724 RepID=UPI001BAC1D77|nr:nitrate reductase [Kistimonas asteriae]
MSVTEAAEIRTTCAYCGVGCGIVAEKPAGDAEVIAVSGDSLHPANLGRLCSKGSALGETVHHENRLFYPMVNGNRVTWDAALTDVVSRLQSTIEQYGPQSVALYGSGQLLTEDYYVANKLMKGFVGSANIDTNSRLCMASTVAGQKRAFGTDTVPGCYEDLELADCLVLVGSNMAWCHPVLFQRIRAVKQARGDQMKVIVIDPRRTDTCDIADLFLPIQPGTDSVLFNGLLVWLVDRNVVDEAYIKRHTTGFDRSLAQARMTSPSVAIVATKCGLEPDAVEAFYRWFAENGRSVTAWSQGVNQSSAGTDKVNAILNCHLATGRIGKPGSTPFSLTGQPNAMGGREVGGLANQLAAHLEFNRTDDVERVARFWQAPNMVAAPGLTAVEMFDAVARGDIRFIWIMGTNPVVSMPDADRVKQALSDCPAVVVSDCIKNTDTADVADILLPAAGWSEKDGTVTNSERRISRQRRLRTPVGESRPDWAIMSEVGRRLGYSEAFSFQSPVEIFREHAALSAFENCAGLRPRDFHIGGLKDISGDAYDRLVPIQWPVRATESVGEARLLGDGQFYTETGRANFVSVSELKADNVPDQRYPLVLNTGRVRDHWHTMTRTALAPRLNQHRDEPFVELHPDDAASREIIDQSLVVVSSQWGQVIVRAKVTTHQQSGHVFVPMHWSGQFSRSGRVGSVVNPVVDPFSRQPDSKYTPVELRRFVPERYGILLSRSPVALPETEYAVSVKSAACYRYELAAADDRKDGFSAFLPEFSAASVIEYDDVTNGVKRCLYLQDGDLVAMLFESQNYESLIDRAGLESAFIDDQDMALLQWQLLSGQPGKGAGCQGRQICACFGVGENAIVSAILKENLESVESVGKLLKAGTNCGSCIPEIRQLLASVDG